MVEPVTTVGLGIVAAYLGKDGLNKLLGPTADYLGTGLRDLVQKRSEAAGKIFENATRKLGDRINQPGEVPPKLLKHVIEDGSFANDQIEIEYLGGILASSRSSISRDNRGVALAKTVDRMSNYQIRAHYVIYSVLFALFRNTGLKPDRDGRTKMQIFIPLPQFSTSMEFSKDEFAKIMPLISHIFFGLHKENLIEGHFEFGPPEGLQKINPKIKDYGIVLQPSAAGFELFMWAFGKSDIAIADCFGEEFDSEINGMTVASQGCLALKI